jgi:hypothetical protein
MMAQCSALRLGLLQEIKVPTLQQNFFDGERLMKTPRCVTDPPAKKNRSSSCGFFFRPDR